MYRNVYWHHTVRGATALYKRIVHDALSRGTLKAAELSGFTDEGLLGELQRTSPSPLLDALSSRHLYKRALQCPAAELPPGAGEWIASEPALVALVEDRLASELGMASGEVLLDYPAKTQMLGLDLPVVRRDGSILRITSSQLDGAINLPALSEQLYSSARWLRVFVARRTDVPKAPILALARLSADDVRRLLAEGRSLLR
jgi:hypothetical protein